MSYSVNVLLAIDQFANTLLAGAADETLSSRAYRMQIKNQPYWGWTAKLIDMVFFWQLEHCKLSYEAEVARRQLPRGFH